MSASRARQQNRIFMRPRRVITMVIAGIVLVMIIGSFWVNVIRPHNSGSMEGMAGSGGTAASAESEMPGMAMDDSSGKQSESDGPVPPSLAGIPLANVQQGDEAKMHIEQLHGQSLGAGTDQAWLAHYSDNETTLWVTRSNKKADATDLIDRMTAAIGRGGSPFTNPQPLKGVEGYELDGMGQKHFYFIVGRDVVWLAISPESADQGFRDLLAYVRGAGKS